MTRRTKQYFLICFLCFMLSLVIGLVVKFSFHGYRDFQSMETKENLSKYQLQIMETNNESVFLKTKNLKKYINLLIIEKQMKLFGLMNQRLS